MSFLYPLGLLGLIGIPILILIYIIKSKYTEQTVSATYLWTLSERFLKKRKRDNKLTGIISLILQILAIVIISLTIAHPVITVPNAAKEYCFVLDASGSMNIKSAEETTRFEIGKNEISELISDAKKGSTYTLLCVGSETITVFEREADKEKALLLLDELKVGFVEENFGSAQNKAQSYFNENPGVKTYLITDNSYNDTDNIEVINVGSACNNYALTEVEYDHTMNDVLTVKGKVVSYQNDGTVTVELLVNDEISVSKSIELQVSKEKPSEFELSVDLEKFQKAVVRITNEDGLMLDNESVIFNVKSENSYKTLLVSDTPFFLETVLDVVSNADVKVMTPDEYLKKEDSESRDITGYGLYIFHSCNPKAVPKDGSVWLINTTKSIENSGFNYQGENKLDKAETIVKSKASATMIKKLLENVDGSEIYISKYSKYDVYRNFSTLFTHEGNPLIFTGANTYGNREVVFAFDLHDSDMPLLADYVMLVKNLLDFSFPVVIEKTSYYCGENAQINVIANCESIRVDTPMNNVTHLSVHNTVSELKLDEVGIYKITAMISGQPREFYIYSAMPEAEREPVTEPEERIGLSGEAGEGGLDAIYDELIVFFICLAVIFVAEWVVYCYEKYQLR